MPILAPPKLARRALRAVARCLHLCSPVFLPAHDSAASQVSDGGSAAWFPDPNATRLFFAPTARTLPSGRGYLALHEGFFPGAAVVLGSRITIAAGMSLFPGVELRDQITYVMPRVAVATHGNVHFAVGGFYLTVPDFIDEGQHFAAGLAFGLATFGGADGAVTLGFGYGLVDLTVAGRPMLLVGGERRVARHLALITENWLLPSAEGPLLTGGLRVFWRRFAVDAAALVIPRQHDHPALPIVNFVYNF